MQFDTALKLKAAHWGCGGNVLCPLSSLVDGVADESKGAFFWGILISFKIQSFSLGIQKG